MSRLAARLRSYRLNFRTRYLDRPLRIGLSSVAHASGLVGGFVVFLVYVGVSRPRFGRIRDNVSRAESLPVEKKSSVAQKIR